MVYRAWLAILVAFALVLPAAAQDNGSGATPETAEAPSCDAVYADYFTAWISYVHQNGDVPARADPEDPCYAVQVQAEGDAVMWQPSETAAATPLPPPTSVPIAVPAPPTPPRPDVTPVPLPAPPSASPGPGRLDLAAAALRAEDLPAGFAVATTDANDNGPTRMIFTLFQQQPSSQQAGHPSVVTVDLRAPASATEPNPDSNLEALATNTFSQTPLAQLQSVAGPTIGDESRWYQGSLQAGGGSGTPSAAQDVNIWAVVFRVGNNVGIMTTGTMGGVSPQDDTARIAQSQVTRLRSAPVVTAPVAIAPVASPSISIPTSGSTSPGSTNPTSVVTIPIDAPPGALPVQSAAPPPPPPVPTATPSGPVTGPATGPATSGMRPGFNPNDYVNRGNAFNCSDFASQAEAQAVLRADPRDPNRLDTGRNGIACPNNPPPRDTQPPTR